MAGPVVLTGANGAGKTNLIEAISLLAPGRGLRRATMEELAFSEGDGAWAVNAELEGMLGLATLGTGIDPPAGEDSALDTQMPHRPRECRLGSGLRRPSARGVACARHGPAVQRAGLRAAAFSRPPGAGGRCPAFQPRRRARAFVALAQPTAGRCPAAIRIGSTRSSTRPPRSRWRWRRRARKRSTACRARSPRRAIRRRNFRAPKSRSTAGWKNCCPTTSAIEIEDRYRALLKDNRARDAAAGRTLDGPHLSDLAVTHASKGIPASDASTGEQKALLIRLVLAHAGLIKDMTGFAPLLLLDEIVAHLDPARRAALYDALSNLGAQVWMTGADPAAFGDIVGRAQVFEVRGGTVGVVPA